jgi:hypothetical protein
MAELGVLAISDIRDGIVSVAVAVICTYLANGEANREHLGGFLQGLQVQAIACGLDWSDILDDVQKNVELGSGMPINLLDASQLPILESRI